MRTAETNRLRKLLAAAGAPEGALHPIAQLVDLVASDPEHAPTSIVEPSAVLEQHVADALDGLAVPQVRDAHRLVDLGSGAGFPGLVLAAVLPAARVAVLDSATRKCAFLRRAAGAMGLDRVEVVHARIEEWQDAPPGPDVITVRAVAPLNVLLEYAAPVLAPGGHLVAWKGHRDAAEEADAAAAAAATGLESAGVLSVPARASATDHHLHVYAKVAQTPERFPRRPGVARKRPVTAGA